MMERRTKVLVDPKLQFKYIKTITGLLVIFSIAVGLTMYGGAWFVLNVAQLGQYAEKQFAQIFSRLAYLFIIETAIFVLLSIIISIRISHKFVGPISRIKEYFKEIGSTGDFSQRIKVRKGDELEDFVNEFNNMLTKLQNKISSS